MRKVIALTGAALLSAAPAARSAPADPPPPKPNIVFILADDMGYGDPGCYGQTKIQTPNIDALAKQGMRFTQAYAGAAVCAPSRCSLLTGLHTGHTLIRGNAKVSLRPQDRTVAEILKDAGYDTVAVGKWGVGEPGSAGVPTKKGFNFFYGYIDQTAAHNYYPTFLYRNEEKVPLRNIVPNPGPYGQGVATTKLDYSGDLCNKELLAYLAKAPTDKPFFMYAAYTLPHANNEAHENEVPELGVYATKDWPLPDKQYAALCTQLDTYVGSLTQALKIRHLDQNTLIIFTSDNGAQAEGNNDPAFFDSSGPFRGIKRAVYEGGVREPMVAVWPGHITPGTTTDQIFTFWDFLPTAADLAGAAIPPNLDGISLAPVFEGKPQPTQHEFLYWEFHEGGFHQGVRHGDWKAVRHGLTAPLELYDLKTDIAESHNVAADHPDVVAKILDYLKTARTESPDFPIGR
jgi:arylsulfatase A-like enzyme